MHTLIFDIGKTNKKCFLFDEKFKEIDKSYTRIEQIKDHEGFPCDDLEAIEQWMKQSLKEALKKNDDITGLNFSTYGASFVHIDKDGKPLLPLINYLKPFPKKILKLFYKKHGKELKIAQETASPPLGMLNSGLQLFWLKYAHPDIFKKIYRSLHLPQYFSYLFTGLPVSEFTSIGCHTGLWDYERNDYHRWVYAEGIDRILPPIVHTGTSVNTEIFGKKLKIGVGIHDSSAALLPYLNADKKPFLLISTGTWSIALNPYSVDSLSNKDLKNDCLNFMRTDGKSVKAARLFLGNEYSLQVKKLQQFFNKKRGAHKSILFDEKIYHELKKDATPKFHFSSIELKRNQPSNSDFVGFKNFKTAYHQLMLEMTEMQTAAVKRALGSTKINKLYIDGGFADNDLFVKMLALQFSELKIRTTQSPLGSALGASMVIADKAVEKKFFKKIYAMKKV